MTYSHDLNRRIVVRAMRVALDHALFALRGGRLPTTARYTSYRRDPIAWIFATAAYGVESLLFIRMVLLIDRACGWLGKHFTVQLHSAAHPRRRRAGRGRGVAAGTARSCSGTRLSLSSRRCGG